MRVRWLRSARAAGKTLKAHLGTRQVIATVGVYNNALQLKRHGKVTLALVYDFTMSQ